MTEDRLNKETEKFEKAATLIDLWINAIEKTFGKLRSEQQNELLKHLDPKTFYHVTSSTSAAHQRATLLDEVVQRIQKILSIQDQVTIEQIRTAVAQALAVGVPFEHNTILEAYQLDALRLRIEHLETRLKSLLERSDQSHASEHPAI